MPERRLTDERDDHQSAVRPDPGGRVRQRLNSSERPRRPAEAVVLPLECSIRARTSLQQQCKQFAALPDSSIATVTEVRGYGRQKGQKEKKEIKKKKRKNKKAKKRKKRKKRKKNPRKKNLFFQI